MNIDTTKIKEIYKDSTMQATFIDDYVISSKENYTKLITLTQYLLDEVERLDTRIDNIRECSC